MFPITRPILVVVIIFLILYHKNLTDLEYAAKRAAKATVETVVDTAADKMPLVVPGLQSKSGEQDKTTKWMNELVGKQIGEQSDATTFAKADLPAKHRILAPNSVSTTDFVEDRLNIHTDDKGTVLKVTHG